MALCACMGPIGNDPLCPCQMRQTGLVPTEIWTPEKKADLRRAMQKLADDERALRRDKIDTARQAQPIAALRRKADKARRKGFWTIEDMDFAKAEAKRLSAMFGDDVPLPPNT